MADDRNTGIGSTIGFNADDLDPVAEWDEYRAAAQSERRLHRYAGNPNGVRTVGAASKSRNVYDRLLDIRSLGYAERGEFFSWDVFVNDTQKLIDDLQELRLKIGDKAITPSIYQIREFSAGALEYIFFDPKDGLIESDNLLLVLPFLFAKGLYQGAISGRYTEINDVNKTSVEYFYLNGLAQEAVGQLQENGSPRAAQTLKNYRGAHMEFSRALSGHLHKQLSAQGLSGKQITFLVAQLGYEFGAILDSKLKKNMLGHSEWELDANGLVYESGLFGRGDPVMNLNDAKSISTKFSEFFPEYALRPEMQEELPEGSYCSPQQALASEKQKFVDQQTLNQEGSKKDAMKRGIDPAITAAAGAAAAKSGDGSKEAPDQKAADTAKPANGKPAETPQDAPAADIRKGDTTETTSANKPELSKVSVNQDGKVMSGKDKKNPPEPKLSSAAAQSEQKELSKVSVNDKGELVTNGGDKAPEPAPSPVAKEKPPEPKAPKEPEAAAKTKPLARRPEGDKVAPPPVASTKPTPPPVTGDDPKFSDSQPDAPPSAPPKTAPEPASANLPPEPLPADADSANQVPATHTKPKGAGNPLGEVLAGRDKAVEGEMKAPRPQASDGLRSHMDAASENAAARMEKRRKPEPIMKEGYAVAAEAEKEAGADQEINLR